MDILLLEDDPLVAELIELVLGNLAVFRVASRLNTPEALRMLRQSGLDVEKWWPKTATETSQARPSQTTSSLSSVATRN